MQQIYQQLSVLKLNGIRDALIQQAEQPNHYNELSFSERLALLLDQELNQRENRKITRLIRQAKFRVRAQLEQVNYRATRNSNKSQIRSLAQGEWLRLHQNILITGEQVVGKPILPVHLEINTASKEEA